MAKRGELLWHVVKVHDNGAENHVALRKDGVLLKKFVAVIDDNLFGTGGQTQKRRHDYGWKIYTRKPKADAKEICLRSGYVEY
jgi:hypothetical protein